MTRSPASIFSSSWWKLKPEPIVTDARLAHVYLGAGLAMGPACFGLRVLLISMPIVLLGFVGWELLFPLLRRINPRWGGRHPFGDVIDLAAFVLGWAVGLVVGLSGILARKAL